MTILSRREMLQIAAAAAGASGCGPQALAVAAEPRRPPGPQPIVAELVPERFTSLAFESQQLGGLLAQRMHVNVEGRLLHVDDNACLSGFVHRNSAGEFDAAWVGEHAGKFLDAACNALRYRENVTLRRKLDRVARTLIATQEPDGYLGTYSAASRWTGWDVWVHKYNLIGLMAYYELTGDAGALKTCSRVGDLLARTFGDAPGQRDIISAGEHLGMAATSVLEPMCRLYRFTGNSRYLEFCQYVVRAYDHPHGPRIVTTLLQTGCVYRTANGKAYEMLSNFNGLLDLYRLTADKTLLNTVLRAWADIVQTQLYGTGTVSAGEHFQPTGRLLSLPSSNVGETCATVTWLQLNWRLLRLTGEARFGHEIERTVYNHLLAAQDARNGNVSYYTALAGPKEFTDALLCCVSSGPRAISLIPALAWGLAPDALVINLYTPGRIHFEIQGVPVQVLSQTQFPSEGTIRLTVSAQRPSRFTIRLRVPEWTTHFEVRTGSQTLEGVPGEMLDVSQTWTSSSRLEIEMDLPACCLPGAPSYPDYVMVRRGPQVLALEAAVNPTVSYLGRVSLSEPSAALAGMRAVKVSGWTGHQIYELQASVASADSSGELYLNRRGVRFVPFADVISGRAWITRADRARGDRPPVTAFARATLSVISTGLEPTGDGDVATDIAEFLTDENPKTWCSVDPRTPGWAHYFGAPLGKRGDPVWFGVILPLPATISRVVFRHGTVSATGGWFDTTEMKPRIEVARASIPTSANNSIFFVDKVEWETVGTLETYPRGTASTPPALEDGQAFELHLSEPRAIYGLRLVGRPGGDYASCAELSAFT